MEYLLLTLQIPDFISRQDISQMSDAQLDEFLDNIRARRMASFYVFEQTQADLAQVQEEKAKVMLEKELDQIIKTVASVDKGLEKLETRINKLRGLRIQAGLTLI